MTCKKCGLQVPENETICPKCGMDNSAEEMTLSVPVAESVVPKGFLAKKNIIIIIIAALLALGVGGTAVALGITNIPANRVSRYMGAAERYLSEMNYEQAIIEFQWILEIEPMNIDAYLGLANAYIAMDDTDKALEWLNKGYEQTDSSAIIDKIVNIYLDTAEKCIASGDIDKALGWLNKGYEQTGDARIQAKIDELTKPFEPETSEPEIGELAEPEINEPEAPAYESMGSVTIMGTEFDIATTERLLIFNKTLYDSRNTHIPLIDDPEKYDYVIYLDDDLSKEEYNKIASLSQLKRLKIYAGLTDLYPLASLTNLNTLFLVSNKISDITPLAGLTNLHSLDLGDNQISNITPLSGLINLISLDLSGNQVSDITSLAGLRDLQNLYLWDNQISDITPLFRLTNLRSLHLAENQIIDITPLVNLMNLESLELCGNQISDITPLAGLVNLAHLHLEDNQISDITPLVNLTNLESLELWGNQISEAGTEQLRAHLPNCEIH